MYQIPELRKYPKLFHAFSTRQDGNMANVILGEERNLRSVLKNRTKFLESINVDIEKTICMWVIHGETILDADPKLAGISMKDRFYAVKCEALITNKKNLFLFLLIADCIPLIIYDPKKEVIALVHVGWRGADVELVKKVVKKLEKEYSINPSDLIAGLGPAADKKSYIKENPEMLGNVKWKGFLKKAGKDKYGVNFVGLTKKQLQETGVKKDHIFECGLDTITTKQFFSHYRDARNKRKDRGRFACVVGLIR